MKRILTLLLALSLLTGCGTTTVSSSSNDVTNKFKEIDEYIIEVEEYTTLDYEAGDKFYAESNDNWGGGCSSISKMVDGHRLVGRNMDLNITNKCAYIIRTNAGEHKTLGVAYTFRDYSPDYNDISENGFSEDLYKRLPFMCDDVLNDAGLHIEINMRHAEFWPNGEDMFSCPGTNPDSDTRIHMFEVPRYVGEHCATVEEAKEYVSTLDIYSKQNYWNYGYLVSDSQGNSSLLEITKDAIYWLDEDKIKTYDWLKKYDTKAIGQTNFYLNEDAWSVQDIKSGEGRFTTLQKGIDKVKSRSDMYDLMRKIQFSNYYLGYEECLNNYFDPKSELVGEAGYGTYDFVHDQKNLPEVKRILDESSEVFLNMSRQERQDDGTYWESTFTEVVDVNEQEMFIRFFENEDKLYLISFDGTTKLNSISDWK